MASGEAKEHMADQAHGGRLTAARWIGNVSAFMALYCSFRREASDRARIHILDVRGKLRANRWIIACGNPPALIRRVGMRRDDVGSLRASQRT